MKLDKRSIIVFNKFAEMLCVDVEDLKEKFPDLPEVRDLKTYEHYLPSFENFCMEQIEDLDVFLVDARKWADDNMEYYDNDGNITKERINTIKDQMGEQFNKDITLCLHKDLPFLYKDHTYILLLSLRFQELLYHLHIKILYLSY